MVVRPPSALAAAMSSADAPVPAECGGRGRGAAEPGVRRRGPSGGAAGWSRRRTGSPTLPETRPAGQVSFRGQGTLLRCSAWTQGSCRPGPSSTPTNPRTDGRVGVCIGVRAFHPADPLPSRRCDEFVNGACPPRYPLRTRGAVNCAGGSSPGRTADRRDGRRRPPRRSSGSCTGCPARAARPEARHRRSARRPSSRTRRW